MHEKFESPNVLKVKLQESFTEYVPTETNFHLGYFEGRASTKKWIVRPEDLDARYNAHYPEDEITLWCDAKEKDTGGKWKRSGEDASDSCAPLSKREARENEEKEILTKLSEKHDGGKYSEPQLRLWAKLIRTGAHADYEQPPNVPLITGEATTSKRVKTSPTQDLHGAITNAATAFATALRSPTPPTNAGSSSTKKQARSVLPTGLSPGTRATLRRSHYQDLGTLKELHENSVLTSDEFEEQKQSILAELRKVSSC